MDHPDFVSALRGAAPYVHAHHDRTFVIAFPGETCARPEFDRLVSDIALLSSLGIKLVLVHGARPQIDAQLAVRGIEPRYVGDLRVTDEATMDAVKAAVGSLADGHRGQAVEQPRQHPDGRGPDQGRRRHLGDGAPGRRPGGRRPPADRRWSGASTSTAIREVLAATRIALLSPVGYSPTGEAFNLRNADVAEAVAIGLRADKLVFVLESDPGTWRLAESAGDAGQLLLGEAERLLEADGPRRGSRAEDRNCVRAGPGRRPGRRHPGAPRRARRGRRAAARALHPRRLRPDVLRRRGLRVDP